MTTINISEKNKKSLREIQKAHDLLNYNSTIILLLNTYNATLEEIEKTREQPTTKENEPIEFTEFPDDTQTEKPDSELTIDEALYAGATESTDEQELQSKKKKETNKINDDEYQRICEDIDRAIKKSTI